MSDDAAILWRDLSKAIAEIKETLRVTNADIERRLEKVLDAGRQIVAKTQQNGSGAGCDTTGEPQLSPTPNAAPHDHSFTVLYIEDNPMSLVLIQQIFARRPNIKLFSTDSGKTALSLARQYQPGLILLDLNLPDMHGADVLRTLRGDELTKTLPVVVISGDSAPSQIERLLAAGARNYVTKPFDFARFLFILDEIVADYERRQTRAPSLAMAAG